MRFMVIVKATRDSEAGVLPTTEQLAAMGKYNEELVRAGIMLAGEGLHPSSKGVRVKLTGKDAMVTDGPFAETKELIAGYTLIEVKSREEALEWSRRFPNPAGEGKNAQIEVRELYAIEDLQPSPETAERFHRMGVR